MSATRRQFIAAVDDGEARHAADGEVFVPAGEGQGDECRTDAGSGREKHLTLAIVQTLAADMFAKRRGTAAGEMDYALLASAIFLNDDRFGAIG